MNTDKWRKPTPEDAKRGTVVRLSGSDHNVFNDGVIIKVERETITVARPMAYAHTNFNSNSPMLTAECFTVFLRSFMESFEVLQLRDRVCTFTT